MPSTQVFEANGVGAMANMSEDEVFRRRGSKVLRLRHRMMAAGASGLVPPSPPPVRPSTESERYEPLNSARSSPADPRRSVANREQTDQGSSVKEQLWMMIGMFSGWINILLIFIPIGQVCHFLDVDPIIIFSTNFLAIIPLASLLGAATEALSAHTGQTVGGLLNATFGNVTELIVSIFALSRKMYRIVQVSLLGSILSNLLLVLGCAFFAGGVSYKQQKFNKTSSAVNAGLLIVSVLTYIFPMILEASDEPNSAESALTVSRCVSVLLLITYACYIYFQLVSHTHLFQDDDDDDDDDEEGDDDEVPILGAWGSVFWLAVITVFISFLSEFMVDALETASVEWGVPDLFLGTIIIPIVGNAAEHAAAIIFAVKNKMELALGIAVGSSIQIAIFVVPLLVIIAWTIDMPLSLNFHPFETGTLLVTVLLVGFIIQNGESNWLQGIMLVVAYCAVSAGFFVHQDPEGTERL